MTYSTTLQPMPLLMLVFKTKRWHCAVYACGHDYGTDHRSATDGYLAHVRERHPAFLLPQDRQP